MNEGLPRRQFIPRDVEDTQLTQAEIDSNKKSVGSNIGNAVRVAGLVLASLSPLEASQLDIAKAQTAVTMAEFNLGHTKNEKETLKAEKALTLAKAQLEEARAKDADEKAINEDGTTVSFSKDKSVKEVVGEEVEVDIINKDGIVIGKKKLVTGTKEYAKYKKDMAKIAAKEARNSIPNVNYDYDGRMMDTHNGGAYGPGPVGNNGGAPERPLGGGWR